MNNLFNTASLSPWMGVKEFAAYTKGSVRWVYALTSQRRVPFVRAGGRILFHKDEIDAWLKEQSVAPIDIIRSEQLQNLNNI